MSGGLELRTVSGGTRLRLTVKAGAKRDAIVGFHGGALKLSVSAAPERGKANRALVKLLAGALGLPLSAIAITAGETAREKVVVVAAGIEHVRGRLTPPNPRLD